MAKFEKGVSGNPTGRKKGTKNRNTSEIKTAFQNLLDANVSQMEKDLKALSPKDRISVLLKLADFILPKVQSVQAEGEGFEHEIIITRVDASSKEV
jgi:hypothetical protein